MGGARYGFMFFSEIAEIFFCCGGGKGLTGAVMIDKPCVASAPSTTLQIFIGVKNGIIVG